MKRVLYALSAALALIAMSACATDPKQRDADRLALYRAHAGAPVQAFQYYGRLDGWTPLGDSALAVWTRPSQAYLLELQGRCPDLDFASAITVSNQAGRVYSRFDKVMVLGHGALPFPCHIGQIRPLDVKAIKQAQRDMRSAGDMPAAPAAEGGKR